MRPRHGPDASIGASSFAECTLYCCKLIHKVQDGTCLIGCGMLQVPWTNLGKSAVLVYIDRLYILAGPKTDPTKDEDGDYEVSRASL